MPRRTASTYSKKPADSTRPARLAFRVGRLLLLNIRIKTVTLYLTKYKMTKMSMHQVLRIRGSPGCGSGSGSISQRYGSGSFYNQVKIVRKTLFSTFFCLLFYFLSLKNDVNVPSKTNKQKIFFLNYFFVGVLKVNDDNSRIRIRIRIRIQIH